MTQRFAAISDIHGNSDALAAVLADIEAMGLRQIVNLGDHLSGPLDPVGTLALLRARQDMVNLRGNHDRWLVDLPPDRMSASDRHAHDLLDPAALNWLGGLPATAWMGDVFLCHATPGDDETYWLEDVTPQGVVFQRAHDEVAALAGEVQASLLLCGHTHLPRLVRLRDGRLIVNPGSVGLPGFDHDVPFAHLIEAGSPEARYAILERNKAGWHVTFRAVPYDASRMIGLAMAAGRPDWAGPLRSGWCR
jgi:predicted phosphodiesterase